MPLSQYKKLYDVDDYGHNMSDLANENDTFTDYTKN